MAVEKAYKEKMAAQLNEWGAQIDLLEARVKNAGADLKLKGTEEMHALRAQQQAVSGKMHELGQASGEAWDEIKLSTDKMWEELKSGLAAAHARFK